MAEVIIMTRGRSDEALRVRETLRDWAAVGLVGQFIWLDLDDSTWHSDATQRVPALLVNGDRTTRVDLREWVAENVSQSQVDAFVLQLPDTADPVEITIVERLLSRTNLGVCRPANVIAPSFLNDPPAPSPVWSSYRNIVLYPVDAQKPSKVAVSLASGQSDFAQNVASGLSAIAGLWSGMTEPGLRALSDTGIVGEQVTAARTYFRWLDGSRTLQALEKELLSHERGLPAVYVGRRQLAALKDDPGAERVRGVADSVFGLFDDLKFHRPDGFQPPARKKVSWRQSLSDFLSFLLTAIRSAPRLWFDKKIRSVEARLTNYFYGASGAYEVVLRPFNETSSDAAENIAAGIAQAVGRSGTPPLPSTAPIWNTVVNTLSSLVDGASMPDGVMAPTEAGERVVVTDPGLIAPHPKAPSHQIEYGVIAGAGVITSSPRDPLTALVARQQIDERFNNPHVGPDVGPLSLVRASLDDFGSSQRNFTWYFMLNIASQIQAARQALAQALAGSHQADLLAMQEAAASEQARARGFVRRMLIGLVLGALLIVILGAFAVLPIAMLAVITVLGLAGWLAGGVAGFAARQRSYYHLLHQLNETVLREEWARTAISKIELELSRLLSIYRQGRVWTAIISTALHSVFGADAAATADSRVRMLAGDLPNHMGIGWSEFDPVRQAPLVRETSRAMFNVGWLRSALQDRLELALSLEDRLEDEQQLWSDPGINPDGPLRLVAARVDDPRVMAEIRRSVTSSLQEVIARRQQRADGLEWLVDQVIPSVALSAGGSSGRRQAVDGREFLLGLMDNEHSPDTFGQAGFTVAGLSSNAPEVVCKAISAVGLPVAAPFTNIGTSASQLNASIETKALVRIDFTRPLEPLHLHFTAPVAEQGDVYGETLNPIG